MGKQVSRNRCVRTPLRRQRYFPGKKEGRHLCLRGTSREGECTCTCTFLKQNRPMNKA